MDADAIERSQPSDLLEIAEGIQQGTYKVDDTDRLLAKLAQELHRRYVEIQKLDEITEHINAGLVLDEVLDNVYESFHEIIPYNRIGFSLINEEEQTVVARWARTDQPEMYLTGGFSASLGGSSLEEILRTHQPRILNDLETYLAEKPDSDSTRRVVKEGMRSSLTCPLIANGVPVGFMFFSSVEPNTYSAEHVDVYQKIAAQLSVIVEKGRLVTEIVEREEAIEAQNKELHRLNEMKNALLGMTVHDLRNPLGSILMASQLMADQVDIDEENRWLLNAIRERSEYMMTLINDLLDVSTIEAGELTLEPEPVELEDFLRDVAQDLNHLYATKGTTIVVEPKTSGTATADPHRLRQVLDNLLSNAVKYSPPDSTVTLTLYRLPEAWEISVADQGPGIPADEREELFKPFARVSTEPTGGESSTGLGLAITRRVVGAHGGEIGVRENEPTGAEFWFTLPDERGEA